MTQRTRTRETDDDISDLLSDTDDAEATRNSESYRNRAKQRVGSLFSVRYFGFATVALTVAMFFGGIIPFVGSLAGLVAVFAVSFLLGAITSESKIAETAVAGGVAGGLIFTLKHIVALTVGGTTITAIGIVSGLLVAGLGAYFGGDLRDGLTREL